MLFSVSAQFGGREAPWLALGELLLGSSSAPDWTVSSDGMASYRPTWRLCWITQPGAQALHGSKGARWNF